MNSLFRTISIVFLLIGLANCKGSEDEPKTNIADSGIYVLVNNPIVSVSNPAILEGAVKLWHNNALTNISASGADYYLASGLFVDGNDTYIVGYNASTGMAVYWKNKTLVTLSTLGNSKGLAICVSNGDVYVAGNTSYGGKTYARYWKNGVITNLTTGKYVAAATSIIVSNNDIYVAGYEYNSSTINIAKYWKNGAEFSLTDGTYSAKVEAMALSGTDLYIAGYERNSSGSKVAKYWKNGNAVSLSNGNYDAEISSIFIDGNDVYMAGYEGTQYTPRIAKYWKNGIGTTVTNSRNLSEALSIIVKNSDVYIAGEEHNGTASVAKYWKNGTEIILASGGADAVAQTIFVK
ncbi:hypothetical protein [Paludibacter jiangxiensis]|uniref:Beta-propeller repeat-containing protein n=1 Tax=Paludibacter jiangxiensis TaxID=681398 RepID=A0A170ZCN9_9BACT|nr:hypothetical protein [Paludibacter jiangxiensis]GAT62530.1 hypothetical protein PJIAN_289 [Paludibacter jiangxiensis]